MQKGKVAIYMCCYNHEKYVAEAIESIINQTYTNWELWMANDGSEDDSARIMASYQNEKIHFYNFEKNTKLVGAQRFLLEKIKQSDCEYVSGTASDDKWKIDRLQKEIDVMKEQQEYAACFSWDELIFEGENEAESYRFVSNYSHQANRSRYDWLHRYVLADNCMNACSVLMKKDIFFELGGYNQYFIGIGDFRLWLRTVMKYPIYVVQEPLVYYRRHATNISRPTLQSVLMNFSEFYVVKYQFFKNVSKHDFYRSFFRELIYVQDDSETSFCADKLFFMITAFAIAGECDQIAINMWLDNADNTEMMEDLEDRYSLDNVFFTEYKKNKGLSSLALHKFGKTDLLDSKRKGLIEVFLSLYGENKITEKNMSSFSWNSLYKLAEIVVIDNIGKELFERIKKYFFSYRMQILDGKNKHTIHILCDVDQKNEAVELARELSEDNKVYLSFVRKHDDYHANDCKDDGNDISDVEYVNLYDKSNNSILFDYELGIEPDIMYYIGCLGDGYECTDMIRGYGINVSHMAMINKTAFSNESTLRVLNLILDSVEYL
ncbi:glycosyltransferase family 2 protein [Butyrivibrio sp. YAB3001]|uniref:glycosyltransferase family 2 protein n=1 Tax=Butyrivibrio sp. YAB3001 TaxID=1520812 RepID=UPI0008F65E5C|nr:glycosyltransferase [Butyrivibrio sp. YAB3001]SFB94490.1 Glycosyltransferase, GT2 family [Butyrivibrio sp. YAB3001]